MDKKLHYKLYKSGKYLCTAAIITLGTVIGMSTSVLADNSTNVVPTQGKVALATDTNSQISDDTTNGQQTSDQINDSQKNTVQSQTGDTHPANGWFKNSNGWTYYTNNQVTSGRNYVEMPTINGTGNSWYLMDNGVAQWGVQQWAGTYYYFDPQTFTRVDNNYVKSQWGLWYMFGPDGRIVTRVYQWAGTYYYFDPSTYLRVDNDYRQSQWGLWYMFGNDGRIVTGAYRYAGSLYYFDPSSYLRVDNNYVATTSDGRGYLLGADGRALIRVQQWYGTYYYFDPVTYLRVDDDYRQSQWGMWYMFGKDGRIVTGPYKYMGGLYFYSKSSYIGIYLLLQLDFFKSLNT